MIKSRIGDYQRSLEKNIFLSSSSLCSEDDIETFSRDIFDDHRSERFTSSLCEHVLSVLLLFFKSYFILNIKFDHVFFRVFEKSYDIELICQLF